MKQLAVGHLERLPRIFVYKKNVGNHFGESCAVSFRSTLVLRSSRMDHRIVCLSAVYDASQISDRSSTSYNKLPLNTFRFNKMTEKITNYFLNTYCRGYFAC